MRRWRRSSSARTARASGGEKSDLSDAKLADLQEDVPPLKRCSAFVANTGYRISIVGPSLFWCCFRLRPLFFWLMCAIVFCLVLKKRVSLDFSSQQLNFSTGEIGTKEMSAMYMGAATR